MTLTDYTTYADIRAVLGVSDEELEDSTIGLDVYALSLQESLINLHPDALAQYEQIAALDEMARSPKESRVYGLMRLYATYYTAKQLSVALPMFGPKTVSDGKASVTRFADSPYQDVLRGIAEELDLLRGRLVQALLDLLAQVETKVQRRSIVAATPAYDPVTGEG